MGSDYLCNLVVPGAAKSGTSSLHEYLNKHPMISMSSRKEPHHFCRDSLYAEGAQAHNGLFARRPEARYFGESSTGYLPWPAAAERIARDLDNPKAIFVMRPPVSRCFSHYRWRYRLGLEKRSFLDAVKGDGFGYDPEKPGPYGYMAYLEFSQYSQQCPVWEKALGPDNCLFLNSNELLNDRQATLARCFDFLGLPAAVTANFDSTSNETAALGRRTPRFVKRVSNMLPTGLRKAWPYQMLKGTLLRAAAPQPPAEMTNSERAFVEAALADDIAWFEARFPDGPPANGERPSHRSI